MSEPYYRANLALVHDRGFSDHADLCAPGILAILQGRRGRVVELGCGSGALTRHLVAAGLEVTATDASPQMLELAAANVPEARTELLVLPEDPIPPAHAIVSVGHTLNYLPDVGAIERALVEAAAALEPGGLLAMDICDLEFGEAYREPRVSARVTDQWAVYATTRLVSSDGLSREITTFVLGPDETWTRDDETHLNVLVDTSSLPRLFDPSRFTVEIRDSFGSEDLPAGMKVLVVERSG